MPVKRLGAHMHTGKEHEVMTTAIGDIESALAADAEQCEWWEFSTDGGYMSDCGEEMYDETDHPKTYMKFCYGCGKKIRFVAQDDGE